MPTVPPNETMSLIVKGTAYSGWKEIRVSRGIDRMATDFDIALSVTWGAANLPWKISKFDPCAIKIGNDLILTGYVDDVEPEFDAHHDGLRIKGRSQTEDIIDCTPDLPSGQFSGYTLDQIARAIAAPFYAPGFAAVVVQAPMGDPFPDATIERHETGFEFLERSARLRSVLLCDDPQGRLVLTQAGATRATDALVEGGNIFKAKAILNGAKQFNVYKVKTQTGESQGGDGWGGLGGEGSPTNPVQTQVVTTTAGVAYDTSVPRYRPHTIIGESALSAADAQKRADWQARFNAARATKAIITVKGWRQSDGTLWTCNTITPLRSPRLGVDRELLIARVTYRLDDKDGRLTEMIVGPVEGFTPDPGQVHVKKNKAKGGGVPAWNGFGG